MIYLLIGPKGGGKTFLASALQSRFNIDFIRVEDIWRELHQEKKLFGGAFEKEGQQRVIDAVGKRLQTETRGVVIESTGAAPWFEGFVGRLRDLAPVAVIQVSADEEICLNRVKTRNQDIHIPVSDDRLEEINRLASKVELEWDLVFDNSDSNGAEAFLAAFKARFLP